MKIFRIKKPFVLTIFGASGDLAKVKIFPSLYELALQKRLPKKFFIYGYGRTPKTDEAFREEFKKSVKEHLKEEVDQKILENLLGHVHYQSGQYDEKKDYDKLARSILKKTQQKKILNICYLAVPPQIFPPIVEQLARVKSRLGEDLRLIIEKPFGHDEKSARKLFHHVSRFFPQEKTFLLDHYLGKDAVLSLLPLRYANSILNTLLNGHLISNIQITAVEDLSVDNRISYFDQVGIIKDMIQSHLLQILSMLTMDLPVEQECSSIHREKFSVLSALKFRGYEKGMVIGQHEDYKKIKGVTRGSKTPTFAAIRLFIDRQEWFKVPIYIRTGKMLNKKHTYIVVEFRKRRFQKRSENIQTNKLVIELQPDEKIHLKLFTKLGGVEREYKEVTTSQSIACVGDSCLTEHGRLLLDVFRNNQCNFLTFEEIIATWKFTDKLLRCSEKRKVPVHSYKNYSEGPREQFQLPENDGFEWHDVTLEE